MAEERAVAASPSESPLSQTLALSDVFVPAREAAEGLRIRARRQLRTELVQQVTDLARQSSWLADTPHLGGSLLLAARWLGPGSVVAATDAARQNITIGGAPMAGDTTAGAWLNTVDGARRNPDLVLPPSPSPALIWCGASAGSTPTDDAVLCLGWDPATAELWLEGSASLLDETQAATVLGSLEQALSSLVSASGQPVTRLALLDAATHHLLLQEWNAPAPAADEKLTVHGLFDRMASAHPQAIALVHGSTRLSYDDLRARADRCATALRHAGVQPGDAVAIALERSVEAVVLLLGVLKAGAAYLPLDLRYPRERLAFMLADASARCVVTDAAHAQLFDAGAPVLLVDAVTAATEEDVPAVLADGASLAYLIYTSGSTGTPKGIEIRHQSILRLVTGANYVRLSPETAMLHAAPLGFDASTLEIWGPLLNGGRCILHDEDIPTASGLGRVIREQGVTTAWLTAALFNAVVDEDARQLQGLQELLIGGEALSVHHVRRALQALPGTAIINGYGPSECTTFTATHRIPPDLPADARSVPIGRPIHDTRCHVLGPGMEPMPVGLVGELYVGGRGLARGYLKRPDLTAERFVPDPFGAPGERLYRTGDRVRWLPDGTIEFIGRVDGQVKIRGFRIEVGEIERVLALHPAIQAVAVVALKDAAGTRLVAYVVPHAGHAEAPAAELRSHVARALPEFMVPSAYVWVAAFPVTANGKLDRRALPVPSSQRPALAQAYQAPAGETERVVCEVFQGVLGLDEVGRHDNFFELGGNSLLMLKVLSALGRSGRDGLTTNLFFRDPTPAALARVLDGGGTADAGLDATRLARSAAPAPAGLAADEPIAVIAMSGRFPGAADVEQFWRNLCEGRDGITAFTDAELDPSIPASLRGDSCYVKARGVIDQVEWFDAEFFGISPREAELMDPQQRIFLELCWEALERGGYPPDATGMPVGVFAGMYNASYFQRHLLHRPDLIEKLGEFQVMLANEKDYITTRVAHRLNLTGPAVSVHTACSTSLVAIAQAVASLRARQCDMAIAGGVSVTCPPRSGYLYQEGAMLSPDGVTRSFDAQAQGTVFSDGGAAVLLKRLSDAQADGDTVYALIRGVAVNNDGRQKASFTAPSADGQAAVIAAAHRAAGVDARSISYVETHGTATPLGDPVEVEGLTRAFRTHGSPGAQDSGYCRIGSLKSNVGHMVTAAGAAGVIKTALALAEETLPASIHFERPNPKIDFASSPFRVNDRHTAWPRADQPRRAGVSSFGVGGTNAHAVLEEAPAPVPSSPAQGPQLLMLSARSAAALERMAGQLADHLEAQPQLNLADVAHTLQWGRSRFAHRLGVVAGTPAAAVAALRQRSDPMRASRAVGRAVPPLVWLFPGQGSQYAGMGSGLLKDDPHFAEAFEACLAALQPWMRFDLRQRLFEGGAEALQMTEVTQPATLCLEYALARAWLARGVQPAAFVGHSVGEFAAAVIAGVMSLADAARLVATRARLMQDLPRGCMLSVRMSRDQVLARLPQGLSLAAENGPTACVVAGPEDAIRAFEASLQADGISARLLVTSHAFHSTMMDAAVAPFEAEVRQVRLSAPTVPIASTLTGTWMTEQDATDPHYWARHLREAVRFSTALRCVQSRWAQAAFLEVGPRGTLATLARQHTVAVGSTSAAPAAVASVADTPEAETAQMLLAQASLWTLGLEPVAPAASPADQRRRVRLPTYPFERKPFWVDAPPAPSIQPTPAAAQPSRAPDAAARVSIDPTPANIQRISMADSSPSAAQRARLVDQLRTLFEDVAGIDLAGADADAPFVELGLDSLTLTQAAIQVKKQFSVALTFRQLMEQYRSFGSLAEYLQSVLPPEAAAAPQAAAAPATAAPAAVMPAPALAAPAHPLIPATLPVALPVAAIGAPASLVQQVLAQQMQLMAQQLALLGGAGAGVYAAPAAAVVEATPVTPAPVAAAPVPAPAAASVPAKPQGAPADEPAAPVRYDVKKAFGAIARIHTSAQTMGERQQARLEAFVRRYVERTKASKDYTVRHRPHLADPRVVNGFRPMTKEITYQVVIERSQGAKVWDIDGNEYIDVLNGFGMNLFGWRPEFVQEAVRKQLDLGYEIGPQHPLAGEVADLICELSGTERAGLCNTGSEAVMAAIRIARTVTGRNTLVLFAGSYHGTFDEVVVRAGKGGKGMPAAPGIMPGVYGDVRVLDYGTPEALEFIRANADDLAAVLVEPVQSRRPDFQPREFLNEVRAITARSGTCLIFDEVITGFRAQLGGAQAYYGIRADLACYGKVIGGGFPVGVIAGKREFMDALDGGAWQYGDDSMPTVGVTYFAGTFVRHPLALAAAKAALEHLKQSGPQLQEQLNVHTSAMAQELNAFCREVGAPIEIRHFASLWRVTWLEDHPLQDLLFAMMRNRGVHILDNFPCFMTTAHTPEDIAVIKTAFKESVAELQEAEFLPRSAAPAVLVDASKPPVPNARLGRDKDGKPAWFVPNPDAPGKFIKVSA